MAGMPRNGPGSQSEPLVLKGIALKCPGCEGTDNLWRNESVLRMVGVKPIEEGGFHWDNDTRDEVLWDTSGRNTDEPEFFCRGCDRYFEAPDINALDGCTLDAPGKKAV